MDWDRSRDRGKHPHDWRDDEADLHHRDEDRRWESKTDAAVRKIDGSSLISVKNWMPPGVATTGGPLLLLLVVGRPGARYLCRLMTQKYRGSQ
jgi:hypothetical protein